MGFVRTEHTILSPGYNHTLKLQYWRAYYTPFVGIDISSSFSLFTQMFKAQPSLTAHHCCQQTVSYISINFFLQDILSDKHVCVLLSSLNSIVAVYLLEKNRLVKTRNQTFRHNKPKIRTQLVWQTTTITVIMPMPLFFEIVLPK